MRCYFHAFFLCAVFTFCSLLYVLSKVASSLEEGEEQSSVRNRRVPHRSSHDAGHLLRKGPGLLGLRQPENELDRCKSLSVSYWNPYWRLPADVCGVNCLLESTLGERPDSAVKAHRDERSHLAVVACGPRLEETLTMMKSAVLFSQKPLHFYIFAEDNLHEGFRHSLDSWPSTVQTKFKFTLYSITFPKENANEWKKLFKPCASQRLFLPLILKEVDSLLYVDTDILFLNPVEDIWALLSQFNSSQLAAMAPEHEEPRIGWYNRFARHPYYGKTGINSGVMLMNMTRLREKLFKNDLTTVALHWEQILMPLLQKYKLNITWGDQDLLNIIFHHNPESLYMFPCQWNYRPDHCMYGSNCQQAEQEGVFILHGNRGVYHNDKQPAFRAVYEAIQKYPFGENMEALLLEPLEESLQAATHTYCGRASHTFTRSLKQSVTSVQQDVTQRRQSGHHIDVTP
ncbi:glucoside xylosyltransferase 1-like isoform X1 [Solea senegalensis]|uniref:UDP-D-xylose:beta-D-glucoside alpha-1,3-D-xylosyltransferase n=2 Tax=Solea senegalensis TaxID=28829 RepID=A0AAV6SWG6_SOLSE|nr:glucoside xylosyltransferase 1-like isoform X1 [Solea senegalensis]KAG7521522.1 glucoside xylosyltransferase 1-like isoform X1 [Solea senegalensis]